ncbi:MAG: hypothetical protein ACRCU9_12410 [Iodobacter sp.]
MRKLLFPALAVFFLLLIGYASFWFGTHEKYSKLYCSTDIENIERSKKFTINLNIDKGNAELSMPDGFYHYRLHDKSSDQWLVGIAHFEPVWSWTGHPKAIKVLAVKDSTEDSTSDNLFIAGLKYPFSLEKIDEKVWMYRIGAYFAFCEVR